jgi:hypothetical protein
MSGNHPEWIGAGQYFLHQGKKTLVDDFYFVSAPVHNSDELMIKTDGRSHPFDPQTMKPLPVDAALLPEYVAAGKVVEYTDLRGQRTLGVVGDIWLLEKEGVRMRIEGSSFPVSLDAVSQVPVEKEAEAQQLLEQRTPKKPPLSDKTPKLITIIRR